MKIFPLLFFNLIFFNSLSLAQNKPCSSEAHRQFDFWVGEWDVYDTKGDTIVGYNHIKSILGDCVIEENWTGGSGFQGKSFNTYNPVDSTWNQVWVDQSGATLHFSGKFADNVMALKGEKQGPKGKALFTLDFTYDEKENTVRQVWNMSQDEGATWKLLFDGTYKKRE